MEVEIKRGCGTCTKCCEGWLSGNAHGHSFYRGKPCHFIAIGKGCGIYEQRPKDPCVSYSCAWLTNADLPEWMKPSEINAIVDFRKIDNTDIQYIKIHEAGETLRSDVLSWLLQYALKNQLNLIWTVNGAQNWLGSPEFVEAVTKSPEIFGGQSFKIIQ
jgi:hypothetical protein